MLYDAMGSRKHRSDRAEAKCSSEAPIFVSLTLCRSEVDVRVALGARWIDFCGDAGDRDAQTETINHLSASF